MSPEVAYDELADVTEGYSGSDIAIVCREVIMRPIRELDKAGSLESNTEVQVRPINREDFEQALRKIRPTVSDEEIQRFEDWREEYGG
jgi:SpoVK/Ycf46/Vps4 family AAA+-type ATPase